MNVIDKQNSSDGIVGNRLQLSKRIGRVAEAIEKKRNRLNIGAKASKKLLANWSIHMMFVRNAFARTLLGGLFFILLVGGLIGLSGRNDRARAWDAGYVAGQQAAAEVAAPAPDAAEATASSDDANPYVAQSRYNRFGASGYYGFSPFFWVIGSMFKFFFFMFLISTLFRIIGRRRWRSRWNRHHYGGWDGSKGGHDDDNGPTEKRPDYV